MRLSKKIELKREDRRPLERSKRTAKSKIMKKSTLTKRNLPRQEIRSRKHKVGGKEMS